MRRQRNARVSYTCSPFLFVFLALVSSTVWAQGSAPPEADKPAEITDEVSYNQDIRPVIDNFCTTCHAGSRPLGGFVLTDYESVRRQAEEGTLLKRIEDEVNPMPQTGLMPKYMRRLLRVWAENGFQEGEEGQRAQADATAKPQTTYVDYTPPKITPIDVRREGFDLLEKLQGHWVGDMTLMGQYYDWMAWDYRAIAPSHIHGIYEGGSIGNLFTSFFVADYLGSQTIIARNGGLLNGIYRTSYFVLDTVETKRGWSYYRLVDATGGDEIMWMELRFKRNRLEFNSYTSRFGLTKPKPHMAFKGVRMHPSLSKEAAKQVGFPQLESDYDLSAGLPDPPWPEEYPVTSASYIWEQSGLSILELGHSARDPRRIDQMPHLSQLSVDITRGPETEGETLFVYLSKDSLVDQGGRFLTEYGAVRGDVLDSLLLFPDIAGTEDEFTFTYLHPGTYYLSVIADKNRDGLPSMGDITHRPVQVTVDPESHPRIAVDNINVRN